MRFAWACVFAGCTHGYSYALQVDTSFTVTDVTGAGMSPLDPLQGQELAIHIAWPQVDSNHGPGGDPTGCKTTAVGFLASARDASGPTKDLVQREILDRLDNWDVRLQLCDVGAGMSSLQMTAVINELNLSFGCFGVPASAKVTGGDGYPAITSFTATMCSSTILDVVNNRVFGNRNFEMTIETGPSRLP